MYKRQVEDSVLFKEVYIGNNCTIRNSIILNEVYIGDNTYIENCIVESHGTIRANSNYVGSPDDVKIIQERNERYVMSVSYTHLDVYKRQLTCLLNNFIREAVITPCINDFTFCRSKGAI